MDGSSGCNFSRENYRIIMPAALSRTALVSFIKHISLPLRCQRIAEELAMLGVPDNALCPGRRSDKEDWTHEISRDR